MFQRKIYDELVKWKQESNGSTALLIEGARRIGKSTVAEAFAQSEYRSYILVDFSEASDDVRSLFDDTSDLNHIFLLLNIICNLVMYREDLRRRLSSRKSDVICTSGLPDNPSADPNE